ncbi:Protease Do-like 2 [Nymphaea thermarum]|nr:Protease Do-like 2 [Nymphaea thermarum]
MATSAHLSFLSFSDNCHRVSSTQLVRSFVGKPVPVSRRCCGRAKQQCVLGVWETEIVLVHDFGKLEKEKLATSCAFMIGNGKLLTNAHCVEHDTQVLARGIECDIALLSVESEEFWKGAEPLSLGRLPCLQDSVTVVGYPLGGDTISVSKGVVSRIEEIVVVLHSMTRENALGLLSRSDDAENIGYVIPTTVVSHFLNDYEKNGKYTGFPSLGVLLQKLENPALRRCLKVQSNESHRSWRRVFFVDRSSWKLSSLNAVEVPASVFRLQPIHHLGIRAALGSVLPQDPCHCIGIHATSGFVQSPRDSCHFGIRAAASGSAPSPRFLSPAAVCACCTVTFVPCAVAASAVDLCGCCDG